MHICMQYRETVETVHCIQLSRTAVYDAIRLNPVTRDLDHCKGHVAVCKWHHQEIVSKLQSCSLNRCVACIIINVEDSLDVPSTNVVNFDAFSFFPIYLLKREDGTRLLQLITKSADSSSKINIRTEVAQSNLIQSRRLSMFCVYLTQYVGVIRQYMIIIIDV